LTAFVLLIGMASVGTIVTSQSTQPQGSNGTVSGENVTLEGYVTDGVDGIAGANVTIFGGSIWFCDSDVDSYDQYGDWCPKWYEFTIETARDGSFEIEVPANEYSIYVTAEGYTEYYDWIEVWNDTVLSIELTELTAVMTGYVTSEDGDAVADAYVSVYTIWDRDDDVFTYEERNDGAGSVVSDIEYYYFFAYTDDDGHYTLYGLPGEYEVSVWAYGYSSVYDEIELVEGETEMDFVLEEQTAYVEGWVYGETGNEPVAGALVTLEYFPVFMENGVRSDITYDTDEIIWPGEDEIVFHYTTETDEAGWFEFNLESDEIWMYGYLTVEADGYEVYGTDVFIDEHVQLRIALEPENGGSGDIVREYEYEYIDENDDGNPEYIYKHETVHKGYWLIYEYEYIYKDADSDGNPEYEYEWETGTKVDDKVDPVRDPGTDTDEIDRDKVYRPLIPDDNDGMDTPERETADPEDDGLWAEGRGDQSSDGSDVHAKGIAMVLTIALVGGAFLLLIRRR